MADETTVTAGTMGSGGQINITSAMMTNAISAIDDYMATVKTEYGNISGAMSTLTAEYFNGSASNGFRNFYNTKIDPMLNNEGSLIKMLQSLRGMCESALKQLPGESGVDEGLAEINNQ
ncbi:MAG: hypothetical protein ACI4K5_04795 [Ruminococcus sp.]